MDNGKSPPSRQSSRALDVVNFLLADVRDGLGPYLAIYLSVRRFLHACGNRRGRAGVLRSGHARDPPASRCR